MTIPAGTRHTVTLHQIPGSGTPWLVRVYRKVLFLRIRISSDWFLDARQARAFAEQLARDLSAGQGVRNLRTRQPGWVLHRPEH